MRVRVAIDRAETVGLHRRLAIDKPRPGRKNAGKGARRSNGAWGRGVEWCSRASSRRRSRHRNRDLTLASYATVCKTTNYGPNRPRPKATGHHLISLSLAPCLSHSLYKLATKCLHFYFIFTFSLVFRRRQQHRLEISKLQGREGELHRLHIDAYSYAAEVIADQTSAMALNRRGQQLNLCTIRAKQMSKQRYSQLQLK